MVPPPAMKWAKHSNLHFSKEHKYLLKIEDIHTSLAQLPSFSDMQSTDASDSNTSDPTMTEDITAQREQQPGLENMEAKDTSGSYCTQPDVTTYDKTSPTSENMQSKSASEPSVAAIPEVPPLKAIEQQPFLEQMESKDTSGPYSTQSDVTTHSKAPPMTENKELKGGSDPIALESSMSYSTVTDSSPSNLDPSEQVPLVKKVPSSSAELPSTEITESKSAPQPNVAATGELQLPEEKKVTDASETNLTEGNDRKHEVRRPKRGSRERKHLHLVLSGKVSRELTDQQLREILQKPPSERDYMGRITDAEYVSQFIPKEYEGFSIEDDFASSILQNGAIEAVHRRFTDTEQIESWSTVFTKDSYVGVTAYWWGEKPDIPDCFKDLPAIIKLEESESDPADFHLDVGHGDFGIKVIPKPASYSPNQSTMGFGTVGFVGLLVDDSGHQHVLATVGHIMDETDKDCVSIETEPDADGSVEMSPGDDIGYRHVLSTVGHIANRAGEDYFTIETESTGADELFKIPLADDIGHQHVLGEVGHIINGAGEGRASIAVEPTEAGRSFELLLLGESGHQHALATVGHIMDGTDEDCVPVETESKDTEESSKMQQTVLPEAELIPSFKRGYYCQPRYRQGQPASECMDEICLIDTKEISQDQLQFLHHSDPINCNALWFLPTDEDPQAAAEDPAYLEEYDFLRLITDCFPLRVFKHGAKTGFTEGKLIGIKEEVKGPRKEKDAMDEIGITGYYLRVKWLSRAKPFAEDGDSGSLVFAKSDGKIVPLGLHYGSEEGESRAWLLWSWCNEIQQWLNSDLIFCTHPKCEYAAQ